MKNKYVYLALLLLVGTLLLGIGIDHQRASLIAPGVGMIIIAYLAFLI